MTHAELPQQAKPTDERAPRMLARAFVRELRAQGFTPAQLEAFAAEIRVAVQQGTTPPAHA